MVRRFIAWFLSIFIIGRILLLSLNLFIEGYSVFNISSLLGGALSALIMAPVIMYFFREFETNNKSTVEKCPKGGEHQWGNPWINSEGPEGGELGHYGHTCLKCGTDVLAIE